MPVVSPITHDGKGQLLNTNADTIAAELAIAMAMKFEVHLIYCFEKPGVLLDASNDHSVIDSINHAQFKEYQQSSVISEGMIPKLDNGFNALKRKVKSIRITNTQGLTNATGTLLTL